MKRGIAIRFVAPIFVLCLTNAVEAQVALEKPEAPIRLTVGRTEGPPQSEVTVQVSLSADRDVKVASISMNITFPNRLLSFIRADKTGLIEAVGTEMKVEVEADAYDSNKSILKLTLSTLEEGGSGKALPEGPIAEIAFIILDEAQPGTDITLKNEAHVVAVEDPLKQIEPVIAEDGAIWVIESLIFSCFFYMH